MRWRRAVAAALVAVLGAGALAACGGDDPKPVTLTWRSESFPVPAGSRALVRGATWCDGRWVVVGATADRRGATRPAVWTSSDGRRWEEVPLDPRGDFYASMAILSSVGCHAGRLAVLGAKSGGAHFNPRVATWRQRADGSLVAVSAPFELYGGPNAIAVNRLVGGPAGYLIAGTRASGAAVWTSRGGDRFTLHEHAPGLATTPAASTQALDAVWWQGGWTVVGDSTVAKARLVGTVWSGGGAGPWTATRLPGSSQIASGERVVLTDEGPVVVGLDDHAFGAWAEHDRTWSLESTFGRQDADASSAFYVSGLAWTGDRLAATYSDGTTYRLALGPTARVDDVPMPVTVGVEGDRAVTVAAHGADLLLLTDDARQGQIWLTHLPALQR